MPRQSGIEQATAARIARGRSARAAHAVVAGRAVSWGGGRADG